MSTIRAVLVDRQAVGCLAIKDVPPPGPLPHEALVRVRAISLNRGEVRRAQEAPDGTRIGYDLAGTIETPAQDGSGPRAGDRVVGLLPTQNAWAELVAVPPTLLTVLPEMVSDELASTLPVAGLTALCALRKGGTLLGQRVLITGASGGVGHLAIQLAKQAGATVVGLVRQEAHARLVREDGADAVVVDETGEAAAAEGPYNLILESVGGPVLAMALASLAEGGRACISAHRRTAP